MTSRNRLAEISTVPQQREAMPASLAMGGSLLRHNDPNPCGPPPCAQPPLIDRRSRLNGSQRLPARLSTGALWLGSLSLLGPPKVLALLLVAGVLVPWVLWLDRKPRQDREGHALKAPAPVAPPATLPRSILAAELGLPESQLFRARHGAICTVHHDAEGQIVAIDLPRPSETRPHVPHNAHPVG